MSETPSEDTYRVFQIRIGVLGFIAAAARHRIDNEDHYCVAYKLLSDNEDTAPVIDELEANVKKDVTTEVGFVMKLTKRGKQSTPRLGKLIMAHIMMDMVTTRVFYGMPVYEYIINTDTVDVSVDTLIGDPEDGVVS